MMSNATTDSEARWSAAMELAAGNADANLPPRRRRILVLAVALLAGALAGGIVAGLLIAPPGGSRPSASMSADQLVLQITFLALAFIVGIPGFIWAVRSGHYFTRWRAIGSPLSRAERRHVNRIIAGKEPMDEKRLLVILGVAKQTRRGLLGMLPIYAAATLLSLSNSFVGPLPVVTIVDRVVVLLFIGLAAYSLVSYRRIGRFIDAHDAMDQRAHRSQAAGEQ